MQVKSSSNAGHPEILVIGCGVAGLSTARQLQAAGYQVRILSRDRPPETTSWQAAAIWFPYTAAPVERVNRWSLATYHAFGRLAREDAPGVSMVDFLVLVSDPAATAWLDGIPPSAVRPARSSELPPGYTQGYLARVPLSETQSYLPWLFESFQQAGGHFEQRTVTDLSQLEQKNRVVINCSGLGARELAGDPEVYPVRGQVLRIRPQPDLPCLVDDHGPNALSYIIPRTEDVILGGTADVGEELPDIDANATDTILRRCRQLTADLENIELLSATVGLRPARSSIRLEREPGRRLIHNYGHGGAGFTVSWGCAEEVAGLVEAMTT